MKTATVDNRGEIGLHRHTMTPFLRACSFGTFAFALLVCFAGCEEKSPCETICIRVAECRREGPADEKMLGEKTPRPDKICKQRCETNHEAFMACEGKKKNCADLLSCSGRF